MLFRPLSQDISMRPFRQPKTSKGLLVLHVLTYNGARLLLVCIAAGIIFAVDALTRLDIPVPLILIIALGASLPFSAFVFRKLRRSINEDIKAVDLERASKDRPHEAATPRKGPTARK